MKIFVFGKSKKNLASMQAHEVAEVICLKCHERWIAVYPEKTLLKGLECHCGCTGYVIKTGQTLNLEEGE